MLVTGAARGVGRATVHAFLGAGWRVVAGVRDVAAAREGLGAHPGLEVVPMDVTDAAAVRAGVARAEELAGGAVGCLVLNAGYALMGAVEDADLDEARAMFDTDLFGAARVAQAAVPAMREAGRGCVVVVSSISARQAIPLLGYYQAAKAGLSALAESLSIEMRPFGVRVALLEPGAIATEFAMSTRRTGAAPRGEGPYAGVLAGVRDAMVRLRREHPLGPEDVAARILRAAEDPATPFRTVLGHDAEASDALRALGSHDAYEDGLVAFLELDWPRPGGPELDLRGAPD